MFFKEKWKVFPEKLHVFAENRKVFQDFFRGAVFRNPHFSGFQVLEIKEKLKKVDFIYI